MYFPAFALLEDFSREGGTGANLAVGAAAGEIFAGAKEQLIFLLLIGGWRCRCGCRSKFIERCAPLRRAWAGAQGIRQQSQLLIGFEIQRRGHLNQGLGSRG